MIQKTLKKYYFSILLVFISRSVSWNHFFLSLYHDLIPLVFFIFFLCKKQLSYFIFLLYIRIG